MRPTLTDAGASTRIDEWAPRFAAGGPAALRVLVVAVVGTQIAYPLLHGSARDTATVVIVVLFASACTAHAAMTRGVLIATEMLLLTATAGFSVELVGVHTGVPFGSYVYGGALGRTWHGVPPTIALAWTMLAWPSAVAARCLVRGRTARIAVGAWALAATDLFLDPQMVHAGYWTWRNPSPHLPGVGDVPLTNYAGWLAAALVVSAALQVLLDRGPVHAGDRIAVGLYLWLFLGWVGALAVFLGLPAAAGWGALGMGAVAGPLTLQWRSWW